jgi:S1-C subfamily serine protease
MRWSIAPLDRSPDSDQARSTQSDVTTQSKNSYLRSFRRLGIVIAVAVAVSGSTGADAVSAADFDEALQRAIDATVFVKVDRLYRGDGIRTTGTGFVIHEDGWVLTNAHVVSDTITIPMQGEVRRARSTVSGMTVVIGSGEAGEREVKARVVARDNDLDLALLKIPGPVTPVLELAPADRTPSLTDHVWVVGFPYGELLSIERWQRNEIANPVPSVNQGRISALRRDDEGDIRHLQTDAPVNPGNSGGPMINEEGRVVGVVFAKVGESGLGFAIASALVTDFIHTRGYRVRMSPPAINQTSTVLNVNLESTLVPLHTWSGSATLDGGETAAVTERLVPIATGLRVAIPLGRTAAADAGNGLLRVSVDLVTSEGTTVSRVFRVRGGDTRLHAAQSTGATGDTPVEDEVDSAEPRAFGGLTGGRMSAARSESDGSDNEISIGTVSADSLLSELREELSKPDRYTSISEVAHVTLAKRYDKAMYDLAKLGLRAQNTRSRTQLRLYAQDFMNMVTNLEVIQARLRKADLCRCSETWKLCTDPLPNECAQPWVEDDLTELREILTP